MRIENCPECGEEMESGFVNAPSAGILWLKEARYKWRWFFSSKVEKLQKDWLGFPKLAKDNLPALRCNKCKIVIFQYGNECQQKD